MYVRVYVFMCMWTAYVCMCSSVRVCVCVYRDRHGDRYAHSHAAMSLTRLPHTRDTHSPHSTTFREACKQTHTFSRKMITSKLRLYFLKTSIFFFSSAAHSPLGRRAMSAAHASRGREHRPCSVGAAETPGQLGGGPGRRSHKGTSVLGRE